MVAMQTALHKRGVLVLMVFNLGPGYKPVLETLFSAVSRSNNCKTPDPQRVLGLGKLSILSIS